MKPRGVWLRRGRKRSRKPLGTKLNKKSKRWLRSRPLRMQEEHKRPKLKNKRRFKSSLSLKLRMLGRIGNNYDTDRERKKTGKSTPKRGSHRKQNSAPEKGARDTQLRARTPQILSACRKPQSL